MNGTKLESSWKRPISKFLAQATYSNTHLATLFNRLIEEGQILDWANDGSNNPHSKKMKTLMDQRITDL